MCDDNDEDFNDASPGKDNADARYTGGYNLPPSTSYTYPTVKQGDDQFTYFMGNKKRGVALIINNREFHSNTGMGLRNGTDVDAAAIAQRFRILGFDVARHDNLTTREMVDHMQRVATEVDHTNNDCFVGVLLSHGDDGEIYGTDGTVRIDDLTAPFKGDKCLSLAGKPKLFFIQACRGDKLDHGVEVADAEAGEEMILKGSAEDEPDAAPVIQRIPAEADFLLAYSVVPGYFSWRNSSRGSWFIQALCKALENWGTEIDILRLMTRVNQIVAYNFESNAAKEYMTRKKQIPCITSMLTKDLFFTPKQ